MNPIEAPLPRRPLRQNLHANLLSCLEELQRHRGLDFELRSHAKFHWGSSHDSWLITIGTLEPCRQGCVFLESLQRRGRLIKNHEMHPFH